MKVLFKKRKLAKILNDEKLLKKHFGENGRLIMRRMDVLKAALNLYQISSKKPERLHALKGNRRGQFAVDLKHPFRLVLAPGPEPIPVMEDGTINLSAITTIIILDVEDYHK